jgi:1-deoxy-D-xylulose-5-phosphate reductoisomerase
MKRLTVIGSTGSIGKNTLEIVEKFPDHFKISAMCAGKNIALLARQIEQFRPKIAVVYDRHHAVQLKKYLSADTNTKILYDEEGYIEASAYSATDMVVTAIVGAAGLKPTMAAIEAGKDIALANKETLVMAGEIVMKKARQQRVKIFPVDSEHSAIFQCLQGQRTKDLEKILLTASGGPFFHLPKSRFNTITPANALNHPTWKMGPKITIDSATLMNKGLEIIEARWLFEVPGKNIQVVIHPQSIVHSMVAFCDGSVIAQLGVPDMKGAIAYALSCPRRLAIGQPLPDFAKLGALTFAEPDTDKFPCLALAIEACHAGGTLPAVLNAANETAVAAFLEKKITFTDIPGIIEKTMNRHQLVLSPTLNDIIASDTWARKKANKEIANL